MAVPDVSPASESASEVRLAEVPVDLSGDGYGSITDTVTVPLLRVCPPKPGCYTRVYSFWYDNLAAALQTVTFMVPQATCAVASDASISQAVVKFSAVPSLLDGGLMAANDFFVVENENGVFDVYQVLSISGLSVTVVASVGSASASGVATNLDNGCCL